MGLGRLNRYLGLMGGGVCTLLCFPFAIRGRHGKGSLLALQFVWWSLGLLEQVGQSYLDLKSKQKLVQSCLFQIFAIDLASCLLSTPAKLFIKQKNASLFFLRLKEKPGLLLWLFHLCLEKEPLWQREIFLMLSWKDWVLVPGPTHTARESEHWHLRHSLAMPEASKRKRFCSLSQECGPAVPLRGKWIKSLMCHVFPWKEGMRLSSIRLWWKQTNHHHIILVLDMFGDNLLSSGFLPK